MKFLPDNGFLIKNWTGEEKGISLPHGYESGEGNI